MAFDREIATITVACEASNQPHVVRQGVAASIINRWHDGRYGATVAAVCLKRYQYSEWLADAADNTNLERVASKSNDDPVLLDCAIAYDEAAAGADPTGGATHFYADGIPEPSWAKVATPTAKLGAVNFFKDVP